MQQTAIYCKLLADDRKRKHSPRTALERHYKLTMRRSRITVFHLNRKKRLSVTGGGWVGGVEARDLMAPSTSACLTNRLTSESSLHVTRVYVSLRLPTMLLSSTSVSDSDAVIVIIVIFLVDVFNLYGRALDRPDHQVSCVLTTWHPVNEELVLSCKSSAQMSSTQMSSFAPPCLLPPLLPFPAGSSSNVVMAGGVSADSLRRATAWPGGVEREDLGRFILFLTISGVMLFLHQMERRLPVTCDLCDLSLV